MAQVARSIRFLHKAESALISAIEVYNKPTFAYREETFAILALNAWELLVKAKLLAENGNRSRCLYVFERRKNANGEMSRRLYLKTNRSGAAMTHGLWRAIIDLENKTHAKLDDAIKANLEALIAIRDNAVHFVVASPQLAKQVLEIGTAAVRNFVELAGLWFERDLSGQHFFLMPIGFADPGAPAGLIDLSHDESRLIAYIATLAASPSAPNTPFNIAVEVRLSFSRTNAKQAVAVAITNDPNAPQVALSDGEFRKIYKWTYGDLLEQLKRRFLDFKANDKFAAIRKPLMSNPQFVMARYLDPDNLRSGKKEFYNPSILAEFDKHYTRKVATVTT
jgi:hypothetical protein